MTAADDEASSECVSNVQPSGGLCYRQRRCPIEACSPCISTELTASKFDERGCRGRFSDAAEAGFRTPLPMCQSSDLAEGQPQPISAELLLTAQKELREAYESNISTRPLLPGALFGSHASQAAALPFSSHSAQYEAKMMPPPILEAQGSWPTVTCIGTPTASLHPPGILPTPKARPSAAGRDGVAASAPQPRRLEGDEPKQHGVRRMRVDESEEDTLSSSSSSGSKKRKRLYSSMQQESWAAAELALQRRQLAARVEQLEGYNAHLMRQLSSTLRTLRSERATSQAEITRLHQRCAALAAFLPPSVAAFALGTPPEIAVNSRAALLRSHSQP